MPKVWKRGYEKSSGSPVIPTDFIDNKIFEVSEHAVPAINAPQNNVNSKIPQVAVLSMFKQTKQQEN